MKVFEQSDEIKENAWVEAVHKERWVEVSVRYDRFDVFIHHFILPFTRHLTDRKLISSFYYNLVPECDAIVQLHFRTTPYKLHKHLTPALYQALNNYFDPSFLALFNVSGINGEALEQKNNFTSYDWNHFKILGIEEFSFNRFPFIRGTFGKDELSALLAESARLILGYFATSHPGSETEPAARQSFAFTLPLLDAFMDDRGEMLRFCRWMAATTRDAGAENAAVAGNAPGAGPRAEGNFTPWTDHVNQCKRQLDALAARQLLHLWEYQASPLLTESLRHLDAGTAMKWRVVAYLIETINGQWGAKAATRHHLYNHLAQRLATSDG